MRGRSLLATGSGHATAPAVPSHAWDVWVTWPGESADHWGQVRPMVSPRANPELRALCGGESRDAQP